MYAYKYACIQQDMVSSSDDEGSLASYSSDDRRGSWEHLRMVEAEGNLARGQSSEDGSEAEIDRMDAEIRDNVTGFTPMRRSTSWASDATTIRGPVPMMEDIDDIPANMTGILQPIDTDRKIHNYIHNYIHT
jgi:hypothetical protein